MQQEGSRQKRIANGKGPEWVACLAGHEKSMEVYVPREGTA